MHYIFLGPPGAGKGTQAKILSEKLNIAHLSTGEILRTMSKNNNRIGKILKKTMLKGLLVSDELITKVIEERILFDDCNKGFILDGFPRTITQANNFDKISLKNNILIKSVIQIDVPEDMLLKRIAGRQVCKKCFRIYNKYFNPFPKNGCRICGERDIIIRNDDNENAFRNVRLKKYYEETRPLLNFYRGRKLLHFIYGVGSTEEIARNIFKFVQGA